MSDAAITNSRIPVTLGKKTYYMEPLTDRALVELDLWVQERVVNIARRVAAKAPPEEYDKLVGQALRTASTMTWMSEEGARLISTTEGVAQLLYQSIRGNHPDVTADELIREMLSPDNLRAVREKFNKLNVGDNASFQKRGPTARDRKKLDRKRAHKRTKR